MAASVPTRLGKYELLARIAKGGMAEIYLARQRGVVGFSRLVVIKRILAHLADESQFVRMFLEEARLAALISHPNVVRIYDVDLAAGCYFIAMEFINGPSLSSLLKVARSRARQIPVGLAGEIVQQACSGLHVAHELLDEQGEPLELVHRDVSPHNLMLTRDGLVKLVDFGIAKAHDSSVKTRTGSIKGKYPYMSPEQCRGEPLDRRTDIFSLGIIYFELLAGQRLFHRESELMTLKAIAEDPLPSLSALRPDVPAAVCQVVYQALARDPAQRFTTADELRRASLAAQAAPKSAAPALASYLEAEFGELLARRSSDLKRLVDRPASSRVEVPRLDGVLANAEATGSISFLATPLSLPALLVLERRRNRRRGLHLSVVALLVVAAALGLWLFAGQQRPSGPPLMIGMAPTFPAEVLAKEVTPLHATLEQRLGRRLELRVTKDYRSLRQALLAGELDFAHLPPLQYVLARRVDRRVRPLASHLYEETQSYQGLIVSSASSGVRELADLRGKSFCYVDPGSSSGYLMPRYYLKQQGLDPQRTLAKVRFSGSHLAVMKDILDGRCDAGAISSGTLNVAASQGLAASQLLHLAVTGLMPHIVICAGPRLAPERAAAMQRLLIELRFEQALGRKLLGPTLRLSGFALARPADFDVVEQAAAAEGLLDRLR